MLSIKGQRLKWTEAAYALAVFLLCEPAGGSRTCAELAEPAFAPGPVIRRPQL